MNKVEKINNLRELAIKKGDQKIVENVERAISALSIKDKERVLTSIINWLRKGEETGDIAVLVGGLAYSEHLDNPFILSAYANALLHQSMGNEVIQIISEFLNRVPSKSLTERDIAYLSISLSSGYKSIGESSKAIEVLESLDLQSENISDILIELYCNVGRYHDAIELGKKRSRHNFKSAKWYAKALFFTGKHTEAWKITDEFKDVSAIKELRKEFQSAEPSLVKGANKKHSGSKVFIVHGHDNEAKEGIARFIHKLGLTPIILHEQASSNQTVIEKFEKYADEVSFAVVILTPDDVGAVAKDRDNLRPRARQNVIMELGYFMGKLKRSNVCALYKGNVELPSDYHGIIYIELDAFNAWKTKLAQEFVTAKLDIDLNGLIKG